MFYAAIQFSNILFALFFLVMNMLSDWKLLGFWTLSNQSSEWIIDGNVPFIVLSGLIGGLIIKKIPVIDFKKGHFNLYRTGSALYHFRIISSESGLYKSQKIQATPSWGMICNGISFIIFILYILDADVRKQNKLGIIFTTCRGELPYYIYCTRYTLLPDLELGFSFTYYKQSHEPLIVIAGSIIWAC